MYLVACCRHVAAANLNNTFRVYPCRSWGAYTHEVFSIQHASEESIRCRGVVSGFEREQASHLWNL